MFAPPPCWLHCSCSKPHLPPRPLQTAGIVQGKATVREVERKTDFACFDIELPAERADNVVIGEAAAGELMQLPPFRATQRGDG